MEIKITINTKKLEDFLSKSIKSIQTQVPKILNTTAVDLRETAIDEITTNTSLLKSIADQNISASLATTKTQAAVISFSTKQIPVEHFNPRTIAFSPSRASIFVDFFMTGGERQLTKKAFYNPIAAKYRRRKTGKAYPISRIYGPSVAALFRHIESKLVKSKATELQNKIIELLEK